jgi:glycine cleavage system aminomethyltransferase T/glycine/D-amino acid oxidase-like deaminating enzyme
VIDAVCAAWVAAVNTPGHEILGCGQTFIWAGRRCYDSPVTIIPPDRARAVVIGGGVAGCSVAYHLARSGWTDIVLVEQHDLTDGTTWHSAGFVGQLRSTITQTKMIMYSSALYAELADRTGLDPGWRGVGGLRLATTPARVDELRRQASAATTYGLDLHLLDPTEAAAHASGLDLDDVLAAGWLPGDGYLEPARLAQALAAGARGLGATLLTGVRVEAIETADGAVRAVVTTHGRIVTGTVVNTAGAAAGHIARLAGTTVPVVPIKHQYVVSDPLDGAVAGLPTVRDPDHIVYFRGEGDGLLVGGYIRDTETCWPAADLARPRTLFEPDLGRFAESWANARKRVPALRTAGIARVVHGPEAFTPDGEFLLGETAVRGFWVAAGFCVHGLAAAGGVGKVMAEWIVDGLPEWDMSTMDVRRFGPHAASRSWATTKALSAYSRYYDIVYPNQEWSAARPLRRSPVWPRLSFLDAALGEKAGWERVNWFGWGVSAAADVPAPAGWAGVNWSPAIAAECRATTEAAGLFDQSSFAKLDVRGAGAAAFLSWMCAGDVDRAPGTVTYTQLLNRRAGIEADLTVTRLGPDHFRIVTSTASGVRDAQWLHRHAVDLAADVSIVDVTGAYGCLCLWGPRAGEVLGPLTDDPLDFAFMQARPMLVGPVPVLAQRVTFVGEYGWELYAGAEYTLTLWDLLLSSGVAKPAGYRAIDSMRLEKGYRVWGSDITPETTPDEAGLSFAVRTGKTFLGRDALMAARDAAAGGAPQRRLRCLVLDDPSTVCLGTEPVRVDGVPVGRVTSGGVGYRVGRSIAYAYLPADVAVGTAVEVGVFGTWAAAQVAPDPLFDPEHARVRRPS